MSRLLKKGLLPGLILGLALGLTVSEAAAQEGTCQDTAQDAAIDAAGNIVILGNSTYGGEWRRVIVKYDADGNFLWAIKQASGTVADVAAAIAVDPAGNVYITGTKLSLPRMWFTQKYSPGGAFQWERTVTDPIDDQTFGCDLAVDSSGNIYVTGSLRSDANQDHEAARMIKYDSDGDLLWSAQFGEQYPACHPNTMVIDSSNNIYVVGGARFVSTNIFCTLHKFNSEGALQWGASYDDPQNMVDIARRIVIDAQGNAYVVGISASNTGISGASLMLKYDASGALLWTRSTANVGLNAVTSDSAGNIYVGGQLSENYSYLFMAKYDETGQAIWTATSSDATYQCWDIAMDSSGNIYAAGDRYPYNPSGDPARGIVLAKYDPEGHPLYQKRFISAPGGGYSYPYYLSVDSAGDVRIAGYGYRYQTNNDLLNLKYDAAGNLIYVRRYDAVVGELPNYPPVADAGPNLTLLTCESEQFNGGASYDPDGYITGYEWDFGDGTSAGGYLASHTFRAPAVYTVTLVVTDTFGATDTDTATVTVLSIPGAIQSLTSLVASFNIQQGINNSLDAKLQRAREAQEAVNANLRNDALNHIDAFLNEVSAQRGKTLTEAQADQLTYWAQRIRTVLLQPGC